MPSSRYSALKPFAYPGKLRALGAGRISTPVHVRLKPTNVCNHACAFCAYRSDALKLGEEMTERDRIPHTKMMEIIDDFIEIGVGAVTFSGGGEPLLYPYFAETVAALGEGGIRVAAITNGSRLMGKAADALAAHAAWIRVSIDGWDSRSYARYRQTRETEFGQVMANLTAFAARASSCTLGANIIVDKDNAAHLYDLASALKGCGVKNIKLAPVVVSNDGAENNAYHAPLRDTVHAQIARIGELGDSRFDIVDRYHTMEECFDKRYHSCPMTRLLTVIGADCTVYTCQDKAYTRSGALGSIETRRFAEFWFSEENRNALEALDPVVACRHHCVAEAKNRMLNEYLSLDPEHIAFV